MNQININFPETELNYLRNILFNQKSSELRTDILEKVDGALLDIE